RPSGRASSWSTTRAPSAARRTSSSTQSAPRARAPVKAATVFSGKAAEAPRCAMTRVTERGSPGLGERYSPLVLQGVSGGRQPCELSEKKCLLLLLPDGKVRTVPAASTPRYRVVTACERNHERVIDSLEERWP